MHTNLGALNTRSYTHKNDTKSHMLICKKMCKYLKQFDTVEVQLRGKSKPVFEVTATQTNCLQTIKQVFQLVIIISNRCCALHSLQSSNNYILMALDLVRSINNKISLYFLYYIYKVKYLDLQTGIHTDGDAV